MTFQRTTNNVDHLVEKIKARNKALEAIKKKHKVDINSKFKEMLVFLQGKPNYVLNRMELASIIDIDIDSAARLIYKLKDKGYLKQIARGYYELIDMPPVDLGFK